MSQFKGLVIATPCYGGVVTSPYLLSMIRTVPHLMARGVQLEFQTASGDALVGRARALLAAKFMAGTASHVLFIDSDVSWQPEHVTRLLESDKDVVCATYRKKTDARQEWADGLMMAPDHKVHTEEYVDGSRLIEIAFCGAGFLMIRRTVFERLFAAHPERHFENTGALTDEETRFAYDVFPVGVRDGLLYGEDVGFCDLWRDLGGQVWLDPSIVLKHHGQKEFSGDPAKRFRIEETGEGVA